MINIKELRIGNIVEDNTGVKVVDIEILNAIHADPEKYGPVKVDDQWLEKFQIPLEEDREFEYWFDAKGSWLVEVVQEGSTENNYIAQCFFVHQLQNIYFALTGDEIDDQDD